MADVIVKPAFVSGYVDTGDVGKLGPTSWNAARIFSGGNSGEVVARNPASPTGASWVAAGTPGPHHATHETGGTDQIVNLPASVLTSGTLLDARLSPNVQMKPIPVGDLPASVALKPIPQSDVVNLVGDLAAKAPLASPALTGVPTAPTATAGTSTTQLATTAFVQAGLTTAASANHHARHEPGGADAMAVDAAETVGSLRTIGTGPLQAAPGNDARFTDARPALAHHISHEAGGTDVLTTLDAGILLSGTLPNARLDANVVVVTSVAIGTPPTASQGSIRFNSTGSIFARNLADTADIRLLRVANDTVTFGAPANPLVLAGTSVAFPPVPVTGPSSLSVSGPITATGTITAPDLGTTPLNASNLTSGTVPKARISVSAASRLLGRGSAAGAGPMEEILLGTGLNIVGNTMNASTSTGGVIHAATHQPGGDDPLTDLNAAILTSGTLSDYRLTLNVLRFLGGYPGGTSTFLRADGNFATLPPTIDLAYLGNYATPRTYKDGDIVIAADGISYMCVVDGTTTPPEPWPAQVVDTRHHLTHEVGGNDEILNIDASHLTSGLMPFARVRVSASPRLLGRGTAAAGTMEEITLGAGLAMTGTVLATTAAAPLAHHATHEQGGTDAIVTLALSGAYPQLRIDGATPAILFNETGAPVDLRKWVLYPYNQAFRMELLNDAETVGTSLLLVDRMGKMLLTSALPEVQLQATGATNKARLSMPAASSGPHLTSNLSYNAVTGQWNRDDTAVGGAILGVNPGAIALYTVGPGANPAGFIQAFAINVTGKTTFAGQVQLPPLNASLLFGGATNAFPALRSSGAVLEAVTADGPPASAFVSFRAANLLTNNVGTSLYDLTVAPGNVVVSGLNAYLQTRGVIYPGQIDVANGAIQGAWYLSSHSAYGLHTNTGMYFAGAVTMNSTLNVASHVTTSGYFFGGYVNTADDVSAGNISYIMAKFGENYHRSATNAKVRAFLAPVIPCMRIERVGAIATAASSPVWIPWDTWKYAPAPVFTLNAYWIYAPVTGYYLVSACVEWEDRSDVGAYTRGMRIHLNGGPIVAGSFGVKNYAGTMPGDSASGIVYMTAGVDYVGVWAFQSTGMTVNIARASLELLFIREP